MIRIGFVGSWKFEMHQIPEVQPRMSPASREGGGSRTQAAVAELCPTHFEKSSMSFSANN